MVLVLILFKNSLTFLEGLWLAGPGPLPFPRAWEPQQPQFQRGYFQQPEDFAAFNQFINPTYSETHWEMTVERWRRTSPNGEEMVQKSLNFYARVCCVNGCPFPEAYFRLDNDIKLCY